MKFHKDILKIDHEREVQRICQFIRQSMHSMRREGVVIGLSGGVDSSLCAELCVRAVGAEKVFGLVLPERESSPISKEYALRLAANLGIRTETIDITRTLEGFGTYEKRDQVIKEIVPDYGPQHRIKITLPPDLLAKDALNIFTLKVDDGSGRVKSIRLKKEALQGIIAATNTKQRTRMMYLYHHAERMNRLVCGTTNRSEIIQGFFVKYGDGGVDFEPIAHLYKTQVYAMAEHVGIDEEIRHRMPTPDTYSFEVSDEEFYFRMPYEKLDLLLYAWENKVPAQEVCRVMGLDGSQVMRAFRDFNAKYRATKHLRELPPSLLIMERD